MKKARIATYALLLLLSLVVALSGSVTSFPAVAQAYHVGVTWGSRYGQDNSTELQEMSYLCMDIRGYFDSRCPTWAANNFYGPSTIAAYVYQCSDAVKSNPSYDYLATFHVGHMFPNMVEYGHWEVIYYGGYPVYVWVVDGYVRHYAYYGDTGEYTGIKDWQLYPHTGSKHYFTLIWTCTNGDVMDTNGDGVGDAYGFVDPQHDTGVIGTPYAWPHATGLSKNDYANPVSSNFCYIGFENISKQLRQSFEGSAVNNYADFIRRFYYHAVINQRSINSALDYATQDMGVGMDDFDDEGNDLYYGWDEYAQGQWWKCRMRVYGDGNNVL